MKLPISIILLTFLFFYSYYSSAQNDKKSQSNTDIDEYIIGGTETNISNFPWQVAIVRKDIGSNFEGQFCSGAIINSKWILTAAHCLDDLTEFDIKVIAGVTSLLSSNAKEYDVSMMIPHPDYLDDGFAIHNDIGLIKLRKSIDFSSLNISTIPFATSNDDTNGLIDPGVLSTISGWGDTTNLNGEYSEILRSVEVPIVSNTTANSAISYDGRIKDYMLAAGFTGGGADACAADSGGPLIVPNQNNDGWIVAGIVSWGLGCAQPNKYGIYARVSYFEDWINEQMIISNIEESDLTSKVNIYPIPTQNQLNIAFENINESQQLNIEIYNITGQKIHFERNVKTESNLHQIDLSHVDKGIYFVRVKSKEALFTKKIIVE